MSIVERCTLLEVADIVAALRGEMSRLADLTDLVQAALGYLLALHNLEGSIVRDLQRLDDLNQTLNNLDEFLEALTGLMPSSWRVDMSPAVERVNLSALANRLCRASGQIDVNELQYTDGSIEIFS